jgi:hypothetical protein
VSLRVYAARRLWLEQPFNHASKYAEELSSSPMTPTATPVSAATEQEHYQNNNQDQFHWISPSMEADYLPRT